MPHKRAKLATRQNERTKHGMDLPPTSGVPLAQEIIPKSMARVLHAEAVRKTYREKRARLDDNLGDGGRKSDPKRRKTEGEVQKPLGIKHGESLTKYNRRVEEEMRIPITEAMHAARRTAKQARKVDQAAKAAKVEASKSKPSTSKSVSSKPATPKQAPTSEAPAAPSPAGKTEFDKRAPTTRLNDIVQAPPSLTKLPRRVLAKRKAPGGGLVPAQTEGVISMAQKQKMEEERERAIKRYRELKELRAAG